ncbi:MAG: DUF4296 domain-containing protein [Bacteroidales bacterium]|jgi:hypothetical protein|nr:DUF4296 domain-containing protein [Bacteroidales bacterium]
MKKIILLLAIWFVACQNKEPLTPQPINEDTMAHIIYDIQKAKAIVTIVPDSTIKKDIRLQMFQEDIFKKYNTNQKEFDSTWNFYLNNKNRMNTLLQKVSKMDSTKKE